MGLGRNLGRGIKWFESNLLSEILTVSFAGLLATGLLVHQDWVPLATSFVLAIFLGVRLWRLRLRFVPDRVDEPGGGKEILQLELLICCSAYLLFQQTGSLSSPLYPVLFVFLAAVGGFDSSVSNRIVLVVTASCFEALSFWSMGSNAPLAIAVVNGLAIFAFPFLVGILERGWTIAERKRNEAMVAERLRKAEQEAEEYRFSGMTSADADVPLSKRRDDLKRSSVKQVGISIANVLDVLEAALRPHSVAVFWLSTDETVVTFKASRPQKTSGLLISEPMESGTGLIGAILKSKHPVRRNNLRKSDRGITYYRDKIPIRTFLGVPLVEGEQKHLRGVLLADRRVDVPFGEDDERLLQVAATELIRTMHAEQRLNLMDHLRNEASSLAESTGGLIEAITLQEVAEEIARSLRDVFSGADLSAVVLREAGKKLVIKAVDVDEKYSGWKEENLAAEISDDRNICSLAMRKGLVLPDQPFDKRSRSQKKIFGNRRDPAGLKSVKVAPLRVWGQDEEMAIGAFVVGSSKANFFPDGGSRVEDVKRMIETLSNIAVISVQNAERYEMLEQLATTDALTGLYNRRRFFEMLGEEIAEAERYERPLSLIMTDIDHFKSVNDTYGHPKGDEVLKRAARVLSELARTTDRVCRIGGEEFAIILPQTDLSGGHMLAERFRTEIASQSFDDQGEEFSITLSLGICTMPELASNEQELILRADQALYHAKNSGRNQTVHFADMKTGNPSGGNIPFEPD